MCSCDERKRLSTKSKEHHDDGILLMSQYVIIGDESLGHCPMGRGRSLDLRWMEKMVGGKRELDDRVVCCKVPQTKITPGQLIVATF